MIERPIVYFFSKFIKLLLCMKGCIGNLISDVWFCFGEVTGIMVERVEKGLYSELTCSAIIVRTCLPGRSELSLFSALEFN